MRREALKNLLDIQQACGLLASFVAGKTYEDYDANVLLRSGVERQLIIVGEAMNRLMRTDPTIGSAIADARQIVAFRNILVHGYDMLANGVVWGILENNHALLAGEADSLLECGRDEQSDGQETGSQD